MKKEGVPRGMVSQPGASTQDRAGPGPPGPQAGPGQALEQGQAGWGVRKRGGKQAKGGGRERRDRDTLIDLDCCMNEECVADVTG